MDPITQPRYRALWACFLLVLAIVPGLRAQVFEYSTSNTSEGGGIFSLVNNGASPVQLEPRLDLRLAATAGNTVQVWVNTTNFNASSPLSGSWTAWGTSSPTGAGFNAWTQAQWNGGNVALAPGQRVGVMVRATAVQSVRYQNPGPSGAQALTGAASDVTLEFHNGLAGGAGLPTGVFGAPRGLNLRLYASAGAASGDLSPIGGGLNGPSYYSPSNPFVDLFKTSGPYYKLPWEKETLPSGAQQDVRSPRDAAGWPTTDFAIIFWSSGRPAEFPAGSYKLSFEGSTATQISAFPNNNNNVTFINRTASNGVTTLDVNFATPQNFVRLEFRNTGNGLRNVKFLRQGYQLSNHPVFVDFYTDFLSSLPVLRFMDWTRTNAHPVSSWSMRRRPTDPQQVEIDSNWKDTAGIAWEYCIQLANELNKDMWINVPDLADDDYITKLAQTLRYGAQANGLPYTSGAWNDPAKPYKGLNPNLKIYVEYSNELWNDNFVQTQYQRTYATQIQNGEDGKTPLLYSNETAGSVASWTLAHRLQGRRTMEISNIFRSVFGYAAGDTAFYNRIRPLICGKGNGTGTTSEALTYIERNFGAPKNYVWGAGGGAPYIFLRSNLDVSTGITAQQVLDGLWSDVQTAPDANRYGFELNVARATWYGLKTVLYEGGPDVALTGNNIASKRDALLGTNYNNNIKTINKRLLNDWYQWGGDLFMWFVTGATNYESRYGFWGTTNDIVGNPNAPQMQAVNEVAASARPEPTKVRLLPAVIPAAHYAGSTETASAYLAFKRNPNTFLYLVRAPQAGAYTFKLRYWSQRAAGSPGAATVGVAVNNGAEQQLVMTGTGGTAVWADSPTVTLTLQAGLNTIRLAMLAELASWGWSEVNIASGGTPPPTGLTITVSSPSSAQVDSALAVGDTAYTDRTFTWSNVGGLAGKQWIRLPNNDKANTASNYLSFTVNQSATVTVAYDARLTTPPSWLSSGWTAAGTATVDEAGTARTMNLYSKAYPQGTVTLGGNLASPAGGSSNYSTYAVVVSTP